MDPSELISLKQQVADLDSALVSDPNNEDLLTLKTELLDLISLTETLLQQEQQLTDPVGPVPVEVVSPVTAAVTTTPVALGAGRASTSSSSSPYRTSTESGSGASTPTAHRPTTTTTTTTTSAPTPSSASSKQPIYQPASASTRTWAVGDRCRAMYAEDGKYYEATVLGVGTGATGGQVYSLQYTGYADAPPVNLSAEYLKPIYEKKHHQPAAASAAAASPVDGEGAGGFKAGHKRGLDGATEAVSGGAPGGGLKKKKKDAGPNEQVQKQMAWQNFAKGGGKKGAKTGGGAGLKKSIFATPDNPEGKVGVVGSGKGMTQFQQRGKHLYGNSPDSL
ncbi:hypothetical protein BGZ95_009653 [Linnemannia exigua]|uniref:Tudor domain-containing protein n=1 Tax=Linnemannia exigua TaxID=604196 RepID=A0AAD4H7Q1_9FUNG|nr:hypothetical protein BGZ95_009653 [Linnemannia exigua]